MPFNIDERVKISTKVLAAGVIDGFEDAQWYETRFPNSFSSLASDVYGLSATTGFGYVTANPAANLAAAQTAAAANPAVIEDWTQGGTAYAGTAVQGSTAVRLTPVTGTNDANGFSTFAAYETYNDFSSPRLTNWIKPQSAPQASGAPSIGYAVSLYNGDPFSGGVLISTAAGQGGSPAEVGWIFNADTGLLFLAEDFRSTVQNPFILGFRYIGDTLASVASGGTTSIEDGDGDTYVRVEQTPDDDMVRIAVGDNSNLYTPTDVLTFAAPSLKINALNSNDVNTDGASISIRAGEANPSGASFTSGGFVDVAGGSGSGNKTGGEVSIRGGSNGGAVTLSAGSGNFATDTDGGNLTLFAGSGNNNGAAGDIRMTPGSAGATNAGGNGDIIFGPIGGNIPIATVWESNAGNGVGFIAPAGLTSSTTYTLPSADGSAGQQLTTDGSGTLSWGAPGVTSAILSDADSDTTITVENTPDEDTVRFNLGDNTGNYTGNTNALAYSTTLGFRVVAPSGVSGTTGSPIRIEAGSATDANPGQMLLFGGTGGGTANGGEISMFAGSATGTGNGGTLSIGSGNSTTGNGDGGGLFLLSGVGNAGGAVDITAGSAQGSGAGGAINLTSGNGSSTSAGGAFNMIAGNGTTGGSFGATAGNATSGSNGSGGSFFISSGDGDGTGDGGSVNLTPGRGGATGTDGGILLVPPLLGPSGRTAELQFLEADNGSFPLAAVGFKAPTTIPANVIWTLPGADGTAGQVLSTDGTGNMSWTSVGATSTTEIVDADGDTFVRVENTPDNDRILMHVGDNSGDFTLPPFTVVISTDDISFQGSTAAPGSGADPAPIRFITGDGDDGTAGGPIIFRAGNSLGGGNGNGGHIVFEPGLPDGTGDIGHVVLRRAGPAAGETGQFRFEDLSGGEYVGFRSPDAVTTTTMWTLPVADGSANQVLTTDGAGVLSWSTASSTTTELVDADGDTSVEVERTADNDTVHVRSAGTDVIVATDTTTTIVNTANNYRMSVTDTNLGNLTGVEGAAFVAVDGNANFMNGVGISGGNTFSGMSRVDTVAGISSFITIADNGDFRAGVTNSGVNRFFEVTPATNDFVFRSGTGNLITINETGTQGFTNFQTGSTNAGETHEVRFSELLANGTNHVGFKAPDAIATDVVWTLPDADAVAAGQVLSSDGAGNLSWISNSSSNLTDADGDTSVTVEETADNDTVRVRVGDNTGNFDVSTPVAEFSTTGVVLTGPSGQANNANGVGFEVYGGIGNGTGAGGAFSLTSGTGGATGGGGTMTIQSGDGGATSGNAGNLELITGSSNDPNGGNLAITLGSGSTNLGAMIINANSSTNTPDLRFQEATGTNYVGFKAPLSIAADVVWTLPDADGSANQVLTTNGAGVTSWETPTNATSLSDTDGDTYVRVEENPDEDIVRMGAGDNTGIRNGENLINLSATATNISTGLAQTGNTTGGTLILQTRDGSGTLGSGNIVGFTGNSTNNSGRINLRTGSSSGGSSGPFSFGSGNGQTASGSVGLQTGAAFNGQSGVAFMGTGGSQTAQSGQIIIQPGLSIATGQDTFITGGDVSSVSGGATHDGGNVIIAGGDVLSVVGSDRKGGDVVLRGGTGANLDTDAGDVVIEGGVAFLTGDGGSVNLRATAGTVNGNINIKATTEATGAGGVTSPLRFEEADNTGGTLSAVGFRAPTQIAADVIWTLPNADGVANQFLMTDGAGNLTWATSGSTNIYNSDGVLSANRNFDLANFDLSIEGTGGTFQFETDNGSNISSFSIDPSELLFANDGTEFTINATGYDFNFQATGDLRLNAVPGTSGQVLTSQGAGQPPVWSTPSNATVPFAAEQATDYNVTFGQKYPTDTTTGVITATVPTGAIAGDTFTVIDSRTQASVNAITVDFTTNGYNVHGVSTNYVININTANVTFTFVNAAIGWVIEK